VKPQFSRIIAVQESASWRKNVEERTNAGIKKLMIVNNKHQAVVEYILQSTA
jgi:hypothetical protein